MNRRGLLVALGSTGLLSAVPVLAQPAANATPAGATAPSAAGAPAAPPAPPPLPKLVPLGGDRYRLGRIIVDQPARRLTVPGRIHALDKPLEYLATAPGGRKAYESLLELDASGTEFNLACILVGLERDPRLPPSKPQREIPPGQRVALAVAWGEGDQRRVLSAAEALFNAEIRAQVETIEWAYIGSFTSIDGTQLAADITGTLISFVPDPTGLIRMASGIGIGPYGSVRGSPKLPPEGTAIELIVQAAGGSK